MHKDGERVGKLGSFLNAVNQFSGPFLLVLGVSLFGAWNQMQQYMYDDNAADAVLEQRVASIEEELYVPVEIYQGEVVNIHRRISSVEVASKEGDIKLGKRLDDMGRRQSTAERIEREHHQ